MTLFLARFLHFMKDILSKPNFIDFSCKNEGLTRKKNNNLVFATAISKINEIRFI